MGHADRVVALDTNMLLAAEKLHIDVVSEIREMYGGQVELVMPESVKNEVDMLSEKLVEARVAKEIIRKSGVKTVKTAAMSADSALIELAGRNVVIATNDRGLRKKIKQFGGKVLYIRKRSFLETG